MFCVGREILDICKKKKGVSQLTSFFERLRQLNICVINDRRGNRKISE